MRRAQAWYAAVIVAVAAAMSALAYPRLPDQVPIHWGLSGEVDGFGSRLVGAWLFPGLMVAAWAIMRLLPRIDPREANYAKMQSTYDLVVNAILTELLGVHALILAAGLGYAVPVARLTTVFLGMLFVAMGNVLPRARPNWWFGIRTPWTMSNDRVWARTHRVGGYLMTGSGVAMVAAAALPSSWPFAVVVGAAAVAAIGSIVYSYLAWRQETRS